MPKNILIAYATRYGSTEEVAAAIARILRAQGFETTFKPARDVKNLDINQAIVLGAPLYFGSIHRDALKFLERHGASPKRPPLAIFALGPTQGDERALEEARSSVRTTLDATLGLPPIDIAVFGGKYDPAKIGLRDRLIASLPASPLHGARASDARDWARIEAWANALAGKLR